MSHLTGENHVQAQNLSGDSGVTVLASLLHKCPNPADAAIAGIAHSHYQAGIPVWLIRPCSALHSICVRALKSLTKVINMLPLKPSSHPSIYCRWGNILDKHIMLASDILCYLKYPNPFCSMHAQPLIAPLPPAMHSKCETCSQHYIHTL